MKAGAMIFLLIIAILIGGVAGYYLGTHKFPTVTPKSLIPSTSSPTPTNIPVPSITTSPTASSSASASSSEVQAGAAATSFYTWYLNCVNHHFQTKSVNSVSKDCPYATNNNVSSQLSTNLANATSSDPILCSQNVPTAVTLGSVTTPSATSATAMMNEAFNTSTKQTSVSLSHENNAWKITNITCPSS